MPRRWWIAAAGLGFAITALAYVQAATGLIPLPPRLDPIAMRLAGWDSARAPGRSGNGHATAIAYVAADGYGLASELAWWMPAGTLVLGTDARWALTTLPAPSGRRDNRFAGARRPQCRPARPGRWGGDGRLGNADPASGIGVTSRFFV